MKTINIVLIGVVGVGAVGAYMYMKNKKAQSALLTGSLPANTTSGTPPSATTPIVQEINLDAINLQNAIDLIKNYKPLIPPNALFKSKFEEINAQVLNKLTQNLARLGYKYQNGIVVKI